MNDTDTTPANNDDYEQLVAYLDGELDDESSQQVEHRLAADAAYRQGLKELQRAWDLLDELPSADVSETFTQTTVEMVAFSAERELELDKSQGRRKMRWRWMLAGAGFAAAAVGGFLALSTLLARPNQQLVKDLPVIDDIDLYRVADSVEFLRQLDQEGLFSDEEVDDGL